MLPALDQLRALDPVERQILEAKLRHKLLSKKRANVAKSIAIPDIADWCEANFYDPQFCNPNTLDFVGVPKVKLAPHQKRILRKCLTLNPATGRFPYRTIVYSCPKKSGKSTTGSMVACWFAANVETPNSIYILANDREQSSGRVYGFAKPSLTALGAKQFETRFKKMLPNGSIIQAATSDPESEAGGTYGLTVWDELWAYKSDRSRLLWDELMPILTRNISIRFIVTYAGFEDSSDLLYELYTQIFTDSTETELQVGAQPVPELIDIQTTNSKGEPIPACYEVPSKGLFYYNDHDNRMMWQVGENAEAHRAETVGLGMLETNILRLLENRWQKTEARLLNSEVLKSSFRNKLNVSRSHAMTFAIDAAMRNDCVAMCGMYHAGGRYQTGFAKAWNPGGEDIDLKDTVMAELLRLYRSGLVLRREARPGEKKAIETERLTPIDVWYDPYQMHQVAMDLRKEHRLLMAEFGQTTERKKSDTFLLQQYQAFMIDNLDNIDLESHLDAAKAEVQTDANTTLIRIVKGTGKNAKPIDLAVCQSMALWRCSQRPKGISIVALPSGKTKGW